MSHSRSWSSSLSPLNIGGDGHDIFTLSFWRNRCLRAVLHHSGYPQAAPALHGKGSKVRCVPLRDKLVQHLERYLSIFHPDADKYSEEYLFYVHRNGCHSRMSEDNVRRMVQKYGDMAHEQLSEVPIHIHPHMFRH
ncbi:MAG: hypothetical protein EOM52_08960, partial [Clostridia bacterium]|nr:hypothetical protein [Clostridia bacterium]